jgi:hypothetical protein
MHTHSTNKLKKFKTNIVCQEADGRCFLWQERITDAGIHETRDENVRGVLQNT